MIPTINDDVLPQGWGLATIPDLIGPDGIFSDGDWVESKDQDPGGEVRLTQLADVGDGCYRNRSNRFLTHEKALELGCTFLERGDVLIARMPDPLGRACIFPGGPKASVTAVDVCIVRTGWEGMDHRWLMHFVNSSRFKAGVSGLQSGTTRKRISRKNLARLGLPVPPSAEQRRIVAKIEQLLSNLDAGVEALRAAKEQLKRYRQAVLKAACEGKLVPTEVALARREGRSFEPADVLLKRILKERHARWEAAELEKMKAKGKTPKDGKWKGRYKEPAAPDTCALPELPEGWTWATLGRMAWGADYGTSEKCHYEGKGLPVLRIPNVVEGRIDLSDLKRAAVPGGVAALRAVAPGDFLIVRTNGSRSLIGRGAMVNKPFADDHAFASYLIRFRLVEDRQLWGWTDTLWNSQHVRDWIVQRAATSAGQYNISLRVLSNLPVPLPPAREQGRITAEVQRRLSVVGALRIAIDSELDRSTRLRQSTLKRAFEGKLVPQDPTDEPAEKLLERIRGEREAKVGRAKVVKKAKRKRRAVAPKRKGTAKARKRKRQRGK